MESLKNILEIPTREGWKKFPLLEIEPKIYCLEKYMDYSVLIDSLQDFIQIVKDRKVMSYEEIIKKRKNLSNSQYKNSSQQLENNSRNKKTFCINKKLSNLNYGKSNKMIEEKRESGNFNISEFYSNTIENDEKLIREQNTVYNNTIIDQLNSLNQKQDDFKSNFALNSNLLQKENTSFNTKQKPIEFIPQQEKSVAFNFNSQNNDEGYNQERSHLILFNTSLSTKGEFERALADKIVKNLRHQKLYHPITGDVIYEGEVVNGKREGRGKEIVFNRIAWIGRFVNDYFSGHYQVGLEDNGKVRYKGGILSYKKSRGKHGFGISYYLNGQISFIGNYFEGIPVDEEGVCFAADGQKFDINLGDDTEGDNNSFEGGIML